ncbi:hypothetical protein JB92DRAFT_3096823 [Gautieria morchelliformis]|nr:hypothetical protein JB92DRAFT_3096823 [Gautieria morchelliformis]
MPSNPGYEELRFCPERKLAVSSPRALAAAAIRETIRSLSASPFTFISKKSKCQEARDLASGVRVVAAQIPQGRCELQATPLKYGTAAAFTTFLYDYARYVAVKPTNYEIESTSSLDLQATVDAEIEFVHVDAHLVVWKGAIHIFTHSR